MPALSLCAKADWVAWHAITTNQMADKCPRQVWGFGAVSIIMDNAKQLIRAQKGEKWVPVSLDDLLTEHKARRKP